eukprot:NODE_540_length_6936_cov_0.673102.p4 type:complete len:161 gc:universal NODE_540_length_6936_cov_0.673102:4075-3593(-)
MLSNICVAHITGLPTMLHLLIIIFCATKTFSNGISIPRSPRATITPSVALKMSSKFLIPCWFSILEMILMCLPFSANRSLISITSCALRIKDAKIMSTSCSTPKVMSSMSFLLKAGSSTFVPGKLTFFLEVKVKVFNAFALRFFSSIRDTISKVRFPSSI